MGWTWGVPGNCGGDGNLGASTFSVSNMRIEGKVVQGPEPQKCAPAPTPAPTPAPSPSPSPTPAHGCPGGTLAECFKLCPGDESGYKACAAECDRRCQKRCLFEGRRTM